MAIKEKRIYPSITVFRGVNKRDRFSIGLEYAESTKNLTSDIFPATKTRPGFSVLGSAIGTRCLGLGVWKDTELHAVFNDGTWRKWTGTAWSAALASGLNTSAEWTFTNAKLNLSGICLIGSNGVDAIKYYNGTTVTNLPNAPAGGNYITLFADRLMCAVGNELKTTAYRMADDWTTTTTPLQDTDSWWTNVESNDGEMINGIKAGLSKLTITKPSSTYHLYGYAPSDFEVQPKTFDYGAFNNKCLEMLNGFLFMADSTGISQYEGGLKPNNSFSQVVQYYIDNINQTAKGMSAIGTDGLKLYISLPISSSTAPDTLLVFDPNHNTWYVWDGISALHFARVGANFYIGDALGRVLQLGGSTDNGAAITWEWITGPMTAESMAQFIRWLQGWITSYVPSGSAFNMYVSNAENGSNWTLVKSLESGTSVATTHVPMAQTAVASNTRYLRVKFSGTGPVDFREFLVEQDSYPIGG